MTIIRDNICLAAVVSDRDGESMRVRLEFVGCEALAQSYTRSMPPEEYGRWMFDLYRALGHVGPLMLLRLKVSEGLIVGIGHAIKDRWFDPRPAHEIDVDRRRVSVTESALRHINAHRARIGQTQLNPSAPVWGAAPWSDDDIATEARALGWRPA